MATKYDLGEKVIYQGKEYRVTVNSQTDSSDFGVFADPHSEYFFYKTPAAYNEDLEGKHQVDLQWAYDAKTPPPKSLNAVHITEWEGEQQGWVFATDIKKA
eukprot:Phypoly_transcript_30070.p1 GENE.Phypoly_transcript_30070~~Phypoly_transcript_30070.p1  ORF type:complete len:101 (+),score=19.32 Phypoly_transcript_30070:63-365(+)